MNLIVINKKIVSYNINVKVYDYIYLYIGVGKPSNRLSAVTIRLALAVYCRSPAAYGALKSFGLLLLPSRSTLQAFTGAFLEDCGKHFLFYSYTCTTTAN